MLFDDSMFLIFEFNEHDFDRKIDWEQGFIWFYALPNPICKLQALNYTLYTKPGHSAQGVRNS